MDKITVLLKEVIKNAAHSLQEKDEDGSISINKSYQIDLRDPDKTTTWAIIFFYEKPNDIVKALVTEVFKLTASEAQKQELVFLILDNEIKEVQGQYQMFWYSLVEEDKKNKEMVSSVLKEIDDYIRDEEKRKIKEMFGD